MKYRSGDVEVKEVRNSFRVLMGATLQRLGRDLIGVVEQEKLEAIEYLKNPDPEFLEQINLADLGWHYKKLEEYARKNNLI